MTTAQIIAKIEAQAALNKQTLLELLRELARSASLKAKHRLQGAVGKHGRARRRMHQGSTPRSGAMNPIAARRAR